ncbi:hypothetical protein [Caulobacter sp. BP25]|uniref:hypothetical protein n=1 Tax=Caulobacter sp. BP25 TaxID=2048900 RepID=UPI000C12D851|nr:hypothetical protein [Caulobacter sp. BP25]PHY20937.1 hypothetical protein CSW59_06935 [Caulobacter sp. BP25]
MLGVDGGLDVYVTQPGQGYTSPPTPVFTGGTGSGAVATAVLDGRPTYAGAYLSTQPGGVNGLKTQWDDAQVSTMCAVVQRKAITTAGRIVMGTGSETADGGEVVYWAGTNHQFRVRNGGSNTGITGTIADDQWYFVAKVSNNGDHIAMVGGQTPVTQTQAKVLAARKYALGNVYYKGDTTATAFYQGLNAAEFIFYNGVAKTAAELAAIYARTKIRMARRGLTLF